MASRQKNWNIELSFSPLQHISDEKTNIDQILVADIMNEVFSIRSI